ncbi:hypothetical protein CYMTET_13712 [Cymbomonas tetramitiformis]|uniref:Uncharacterized protein n=1 Tax=Cymbomonas tetramitiformis TaxID=36881 RepID=A0AAE0LB52_9CHLO|nr:hypothetical protein CYMTET_13712 [Cymbomonas tetramitiformis]
MGKSDMDALCLCTTVSGYNSACDYRDWTQGGHMGGDLVSYAVAAYATGCDAGPTTANPTTTPPTTVTPVTLTTTRTYDLESSSNIAASATGAYAFASGSHVVQCNPSGEGDASSGSWTGIHCFPNINDGIEGNDNSWTPGYAYTGTGVSGHYVGIRFASASQVSAFRISRDANGPYKDETTRIGGSYQFEYTTTSQPTYSTYDSEWIALGDPVTRSDAGYYYYVLSSSVEATGIRVKLEYEGNEPCIDELLVLSGGGILTSAPTAVTASPTASPSVSPTAAPSVTATPKYWWDASDYSDHETPLVNKGSAGQTYSLTGSNLVAGATINGRNTVGVQESSSYGLHVSLSGNTIDRPHIFMVYSPRHDLHGGSRIIFREQNNGYNIGCYGSSSDEFRSSASSGAINGAVNGGCLQATVYIIDAYLPPSSTDIGLLSVAGGIGTGPDEYARFSIETDSRTTLSTINVGGTMYGSGHASAINLAELIIYDTAETYNPLTNRAAILQYLLDKWDPPSGAPTSPPTASPTTTVHPTTTPPTTVTPVTLTTTRTYDLESSSNIAASATGAYAFASGSHLAQCDNSGEGDASSGSWTGIHCFPNINDGIEGNDNSWTPGYAYTGTGVSGHYVGIRFASASQVSAFRISRDANGPYKDETTRIGGSYQFEYTTTSQPTYSTYDSEWIALGDPVTRSDAGYYYYVLSSSVEATGIRVKLEYEGNEPCIDELLVLSGGGATTPSPTTSLSTSGGNDVTTANGVFKNLLPESGISSSTHTASWCANQAKGDPECGAWITHCIPKTGDSGDSTNWCMGKSDMDALCLCTTVSGYNSACDYRDWTQGGHMGGDLVSYAVAAYATGCDAGRPTSATTPSPTTPSPTTSPPTTGPTTANPTTTPPTTVTPVTLTTTRTYDLESSSNIAASATGAYAFASGSHLAQCDNSGEGDASSGSWTGIHCFPNINDGIEGNDNSWTPGYAYTGTGVSGHYVGIRFASASQVSAFRISRDANGPYKDETTRIGGSYQFEYTTTSQPTYSTYDSEWIALGDPVTRSDAGYYYYVLSSSVEATGIRVKLEYEGNEPCIDELLVLSGGGATTPSPTTSLSTSGGNDVTTANGVFKNLLPESGISSSTHTASWCANQAKGDPECGAWITHCIPKTGDSGDSTNWCMGKSDMDALCLCTTVSGYNSACDYRDWTQGGHMGGDLVSYAVAAYATGCDAGRPTSATTSPPSTSPPTTGHTGDRYIAYSLFEEYHPTDGSQIWDTTQEVKGVNFNSDSHYLIWGQTTATAFGALEWYYTYTSERGCTVRLFGTNSLTDATAVASSSNLPINWQPVVDSMETRASAMGSYTADNVERSAQYGGESYVYWKLEWVANTAGHGPLYGKVEVKTGSPGSPTHTLTTSTPTTIAQTATTAPTTITPTTTTPTSAPSLGSGCADGSEDVIFVSGEVVGCRGQWTSPGIANGGVLCGAGWGACESASVVEGKGVTSGLCNCGAGMSGTVFYATLQSSNGWHSCEDSGTNDIWGCGCNGPNEEDRDCGVLPFLLDDNWESWIGLITGNEELENMYNTDPNYGGVMPSDIGNNPLANNLPANNLPANNRPNHR